MFQRKKQFLVLTCLLVFSMLLQACGGDSTANRNNQEGKENHGEHKTFKIGVIPAQGSNQMQLGTEKLAEILSEKLGREVKADIYPDYNGVVEAMGAGQVDMAYLGPLTYVQAHERYGVKAIVTQLIDGKPSYYSYLITHKEAPYADLDQVIAQAGEIRFAFGDVNSTSGSLIPGIALKKAGVLRSAEDHDFKSVVYTGDHTATALAIQNKMQDVGAIDSAFFHNLAKQGKIDENQFKIVWQSEPLFQYPWAVVETTTEEDIQAIQDAMLQITDADILSAFGGASAFTKASNEDYAAVRQAALEDGRLKPKS